MRTTTWLAWLAVGAIMPACNEHSFAPADDVPNLPDEWHTIAVAENDDVDLLFVLDDSSTMDQEQATLAANLGRFIEILERPEVDKNYRIGITTTDAGNPACSSEPERGALQLRSCRSHLEDFAIDGTEPIDVTEEACTALCPEAWAEIETLPTTTPHDDTPRSRRWIESIEGVTNLPAGLSTAQALQCIAPQGIRGCDFESPLESMFQALERSEDASDPDFDFIRELATLMVVFVTDEDDCSYNQEWESIFLPEGNRVFWSEGDVMPGSAVCWNAGVACSGSGTYDECHSVDLDVNGDPVAEADAEELAVLRPVSRYVERLQELEDRKRMRWPSQEVLVSVVGGVNSDGSVTYQDADDPDFRHDFGIGPGCESATGRAAPPVRLRELAEAFAVGDEGANMASICQDDYTSVLEPVAEALVAQIRPACMPVCVDDTDTSTVELDPSCDLRQVPPLGTPGGGEVPPCGPGGALPEEHDVCYVPLVGEALDEHCADMGFNLQFQIVRREGVYVVPGTEIQARCERSEDQAVDCPELP